MGTVPNRYRPKSRGNTWCNYLSQSNATTTYYDSFMGPKNVAKLTWSPGMHDVFDSEVVLHFDNAASGGCVPFVPPWASILLINPRLPDTCLEARNLSLSSQRLSVRSGESTNSSPTEARSDSFTSLTWSCARARKSARSRFLAFIFNRLGSLLVRCRDGNSDFANGPTKEAQLMLTQKSDPIHLPFSFPNLKSREVPRQPVPTMREKLRPEPCQQTPAPARSPQSYTCIHLYLRCSELRFCSFRIGEARQVRMRKESTGESRMRLGGSKVGKSLTGVR